MLSEVRVNSHGVNSRRVFHFQPQFFFLNAHPCLQLLPASIPHRQMVVAQHTAPRRIHKLHGLPIRDGPRPQLTSERQRQP